MGCRLFSGFVAYWRWASVISVFFCKRIFLVFRAMAGFGWGWAWIWVGFAREVCGNIFHQIFDYKLLNYFLLQVNPGFVPGAGLLPEGPGFVQNRAREGFDERA